MIPWRDTTKVVVDYLDSFYDQKVSSKSGLIMFKTLWRLRRVSNQPLLLVVGIGWYEIYNSRQTNLIEELPVSLAVALAITRSSIRNLHSHFLAIRKFSIENGPKSAFPNFCLEVASCRHHLRQCIRFSSTGSANLTCQGMHSIAFSRLTITFPWQREIVRMIILIFPRLLRIATLKGSIARTSTPPSPGR